MISAGSDSSTNPAHAQIRRLRRTVAGIRALGRRYQADPPADIGSVMSCAYAGGAAPRERRDVIAFSERPGWLVLAALRVGQRHVEGLSTAHTVRLDARGRRPRSALPALARASRSAKSRSTSDDEPAELWSRDTARRRGLRHARRRAGRRSRHHTGVHGAAGAFLRALGDNRRQCQWTDRGVYGGMGYVPVDLVPSQHPRLDSSALVVNAGRLFRRRRPCAAGLAPAARG